MNDVQILLFEKDEVKFRERKQNHSILLLLLSLPFKGSSWESPSTKTGKLKKSTHIYIFFTNHAHFCLKHLPSGKAEDLPAILLRVTPLPRVLPRPGGWHCRAGSTGRGDPTVTEAPDHTGYAVAPRVSTHMALLVVQVILDPQKPLGDISNGSFYLDVPHTALGSCGLSGGTARQQGLAPHSSKIHRPSSLPSQQPWRNIALFLKDSSCS